MLRSGSMEARRTWKRRSNQNRKITGSISAGVGLRVLGPSHISIAFGPSVLPKPKLCSQISTSLVKARSWPTSMNPRADSLMSWSLL
ncbi:unnamed protein product, partial [Brassica oleracea]